MHNPAGLPADTRLGRVALRVADLERQVEFYETVVGLAVLDRSPDAATLGAGETPLLRLGEHPDRSPRAADETGLFHAAVRLPSREALGDALERVEEHWELSGASNHLVSEALYLDDPEGNGIELYRDRPRDDWPRENGRVQMDTLPLDLGPIRDAAEGGERAPTGTCIGHVHLEVSDVAAAQTFYADDLGLAVMATYGSDAVFLAAGGYHHHVGANSWNHRSEPGTGLGLDWYEVIVPEETALVEARDRLRAAGREPTDLPAGFTVTDPDQLEIVVRAAGPSAGGQGTLLPPGP